MVIRALLFLLGALAAGLAALVGWMVWRLSNEPLAPQVMQAAVAGGFIAIGWIVAFITGEYRRQRERDETRAELQMALRAEIGDYVVRYSYDELQAESERIAAKILAGGDDEATAFRVFVPKPSSTTIFDAFSDRINHLGEDVTAPVIWFYAQMSDLQAFAEDLRSEGYSKLEASRRAEAYIHYVQMMAEAKARGEDAIASLDRALGARRAILKDRIGEGRAAMSEAALSNRVEDPNVP
ncbi:MAG: hypothetical protein AAGF90_00980 [Pseudomonadota bacterium]